MALYQPYKNPKTEARDDAAIPDWRAAAEARGRAAFEAAVAAEPEPQPTPARRAARRPVTKRKPAAKGER
jgi:hypothetical protein